MSERFSSNPEREWTEIAATLYEMQQELNEGRGISAIRDISSALRIGHIDSAKATIANEWDKISSYPQIAEYLKNNNLYEPVDFNKYYGED